MKKVLFILLLLPAVCGADMFPMMKIDRGGNMYTTETEQRNGYAFWGRQADAVIAGHAFKMADGTYWVDRIKQVAHDSGRVVPCYAYINFHATQICGNDTTALIGDGQYNSEWYWLMQKADEITGDQDARDSLYITIGDDSIVQALVASGTLCSYPGGTRIVDGNSADLRKQRFAHQNWLNEAGGWGYPAGQLNILNYWYPKIKEIRALSLLNWIENHMPCDSPLQGFFGDNSPPASGSDFYNYWHINGSYGGATGGAGYSTAAASVDWDQLASPHGTGATALKVKYTQYFTAIAETLLAHGYRSIPNNGPYSAADLDNMLIAGGNPTNNGTQVVADVVLETGLNNFMGEKQWAWGTREMVAIWDTIRNHPDVRNYWEIRYWQGTGETAYPDTGKSHFAHDGFCVFLTLQDTNSYFTYGGYGTSANSVADADTGWMTHYSIFRIDMGDPISTIYTMVTTGTSNAGGAVHFLKREYADGWACFLPKELNSGAGSDTTDYYTYDFGDPVYVLGENWPGHAWDSTYKANGEVNIKYAHGAIVLKARSEAPPTILYISPPTGYTDYIDSTVTVSAQCDDDYGIDSIKNYMRRPVFPDSTMLWDTIFADGVTTWTPSNPYTWPMQGVFYNTFVVYDDNAHVTRDSTAITISTPSVVTAAKTTYRNISPKGLRVEP